MEYRLGPFHARVVDFFYLKKKPSRDAAIIVVVDFSCSGVAVVVVVAGEWSGWC
jgi:hypothetical protein